jgi:Zn-dependent protease
MEINQLIQTIAIYALPVLFAITLHEAAHGYVARHFGDMTAFAQRRISLNPLRHVDLLGTIVVPLAILLASGGRFLFGWAKPVPVNYSALRKPKQHMALVAAAGPAANLAMALGWALMLKLGTALPDTSSYSEPLMRMSEAGVRVNLIFMFLNLIPILPLDGGRILASLLPNRVSGQYSRLEPLGIPLLLVLVVTNILDIVIAPLLMYSESLIHAFVFL